MWSSIISKRRVYLVIACLIVIAGVVLLGLSRGKSENVLVLCGGSMRAVIEDIIAEYNDASDDKVFPTYGGSGDLCAQLQNTGKGDIFICHDPFMPWAEDQGLIAEWETVGYLDVVIIVPKGNPKYVGELKDLAQPGLRLGVGDPSYSTAGVITDSILSKIDEGGAILKNVRMHTKGHQQRCTDVAMGSLDASIVWSPVARLFNDKLELIPIPDDHLDAVTSATYGKSDLRNVKVTVGITRKGRTSESARKFYDFIVSQSRAGAFKKHGFRIEEK